MMPVIRGAFIVAALFVSCYLVGGLVQALARAMGRDLFFRVEDDSKTYTGLVVLAFLFMALGMLWLIGGGLMEPA